MTVGPIAREWRILIAPCAVAILLIAGCASAPVDTKEEVPEGPSQADIHLSFAQDYLSKGEWNDAIRNFKKVLLEFTGMATPLTLLSITLDPIL